MVRLLAGYVAVVALALAEDARADEQAASPARAGYEPTERLLDFLGRRRADVEYGFDPMLTYVVDGFATPQLDKPVTAGGLLMLEVDLALDRLIGPGWGAAYVAGLAIHGDSPSIELGDVHGVSGNTAPADVRLFEAWIEQPLGPLTLRGGILAVDQEFVLAEQSSTLISATFGITSQFSANAGGPVYPVGAPGASARLELGEITARAAVYDGALANAHGIPAEVGPAYLVIGELAIGPLAAGGWHHDERGDGFYAIANALVDDGVGAFARVGYSPDGPVGHYLDAGLRVETGRDVDLATAGIAFATTPDGPQTIAELAYEAQLGWLTLQPDLQVLLLRERTVGVAGIRVTIVL